MHIIITHAPVVRLTQYMLSQFPYNVIILARKAGRGGLHALFTLGLLLQYTGYRMHYCDNKNLQTQEPTYYFTLNYIPMQQLLRNFIDKMARLAFVDSIKQTTVIKPG